MQTIIGAFDDRATAQRAVEQLVQAGFDREDVHVQQQEAQGETRAMGQNQAGTGEDKGFFGNLFSSLFGVEDDARAAAYSEAVNRGGSVVIVDAQDEAQADRACTLLQQLGAVDVDERAQQWRTEGWTGGVKTPTQEPRTQQNLTSQKQGDEGVLDVVQEELKIGKRSLDRGGVRVVQRVSEKPVRELIRLREEHAVVNRTAVDRPATTEDLSNFREGTMEVRETVEEPVVSKTARVVEEVRVGKEVREREETVEDTVRRKDVDIERMGSEHERAVASDRTDDADLTAGTTGTRKRVVKKDKPL